VYYPGAVATPNTNSTIRTSKPQPEVNNKSSNNSNSTNTSANANVDAVNDKRSAVEQKDGTEMKVSTKEKTLPQVCSPGICVLDSLHGSATRVVTLLKRFHFIFADFCAFVFYPLHIFTFALLSVVLSVICAATVTCDKSGKQGKAASTMSTNFSTTEWCLLCRTITAIAECLSSTMPSCFVSQLRLLSRCVLVWE